MTPIELLALTNMVDGILTWFNSVPTYSKVEQKKKKKNIQIRKLLDCLTPSP